MRLSVLSYFKKCPRARCQGKSLVETNKRHEGLGSCGTLSNPLALCQVQIFWSWNCAMPKIPLLKRQHLKRVPNTFLWKWDKELEGPTLGEKFGGEFQQCEMSGFPDEDKQEGLLKTAAGWPFCTIQTLLVLDHLLSLPRNLS